MKNRILQKITPLIALPAVALGVPLALLLFATPSSYAGDDDSHQGVVSERAEGRGDRGGNSGDAGSRQGFALVGTWVATATIGPYIPPGFPPNGKFDSVETFYSDGTMIVVAQIPGVTIGSGVWKQTGTSTFTFTFTFYRPDPSSPYVMLPVVVNENGKLTGANTYQTTDIIRPLDGAGNSLVCPPIVGACQFPGTVASKRYPFANFNTTLP